MLKFPLTALLIFVVSLPCHAQISTVLVPVDSGWARNSVNAVSFRKNALVSHGDTQFISFYDPQCGVVVGKRKHGTREWELKRTPFSGNCRDAHNTISLGVDGDGYLHLSWDHHDSPLRYAKSAAPLSLEFAPAAMTGLAEEKVTYPEFHRLKNGDLLFLYRSGRSGRGQLVVNRYHRKTLEWQQLHQNLIDGESQRNAYWQCYVDHKGRVHLSWVWRESPDVASNHDMGYAYSPDNGQTWYTSQRKPYHLPINASQTEYACRIPANHELINQTSMGADKKGNPYIVTYFRHNGTIPQYQLIWHDGKRWNHLPFDFRTTPFSLSGMGTKRIPIARPQILVGGKKGRASVYIFFRDEERSNRVSAVRIKRIKEKVFVVDDLSKLEVGSWEPTLDPERWREKGEVHLFVQHVDQADTEGLTHASASMIYVLEWHPGRD